MKAIGSGYYVTLIQAILATFILRIQSLKLLKCSGFHSKHAIYGLMELNQVNMRDWESRRGKEQGNMLDVHA